MKSFEDLVKAVDEAKEDAEKFERGNSAAGTRLRKKMQDIKNLAQEVRETVSDVKSMK